jgi:ABC-type xylose transport system permease subunit
MPPDLVVRLVVSLCVGAVLGLVCVMYLGWPWYITTIVLAVVGLCIGVT